MTAQAPSDKKPTAGRSKEVARKDQPEWANGLKRLYDSVVEEDIPDSFKDLLSQLDAKD